MTGRAAEADVRTVREGRDRLGAVLDGLAGEGAAGQVRVPGVGPPVLPPLGEKYPAGRYEVGETVQYTNRGLGVIQPRIRFGCRPEITTFVFRTAAG